MSGDQPSANDISYLLIVCKLMGPCSSEDDIVTSNVPADAMVVDLLFAGVDFSTTSGDFCTTGVDFFTAGLISWPSGSMAI